MILDYFVGKSVRYFLGVNDKYIPSEEYTSMYTIGEQYLQFDVNKKMQDEKMDSIKVRFLQNGVTCKSTNNIVKTTTFILNKNCFILNDNVVNSKSEIIKVDYEKFVGIDVQLYNKDYIKVYFELDSEERVKEFITRTEFNAYN